ncbi:MAG TPA: PPC domain-containing protein, partial [Usitatibacter sp.]|nr:PPC domain-containing protein [Usitatibacter sp.]
ANDTSLVLLNSAPPAGVAYAPIDARSLAQATEVVSISHPAGDLSRWALARNLGIQRFDDLPYDMYVVEYTRGMAQGGSSGSGLFTRGANGLELVGVLSRGPLEPSCSMPLKFGIYGRMELTQPQIARYIGAASPAADDVPNRTADVVASISGGPLDSAASPVTVAARIDYAGDVDVFRFFLARSAAVTVQSTGGQDVVSTLTDFSGVGLAANDDAQSGVRDTGITRYLSPGTYHVEIAHWVPGATGSYGLSFRADLVDRDNHTALWWNPSESGWGINVNHQGNIVFATLFSYDDDGSPMWLVMPRGEKQPDGSYSGPLYRTTGPAFNASPWREIAPVEVGTMRIQFLGSNTASLTYAVNGRSVTKSITRQEFRTIAECDWSHFDRSNDANVQDLWWNAAESGWGINLTQQEDVVFATLFTYAADGRGLWLVMPDGAVDDQGNVGGTLYRTRGPRFDASPWTPVQATAVGTMTLEFETGALGTLTYTLDGVSVTKRITRQEFSSPKPRCLN